MKNIGERIRELRVVKGYSQEELADRSGLSVRTIQRIEKGETMPRGNSLQQLGEVLHINIEDLFNERKHIPSTSVMSIRTIYFLVLLGLVLPLGNIIAPLIGWSIHRKGSANFDREGKNIILTQVVYSLCVTSLIIYAVFNKLGNHEDYTFEWLIGLGFILVICNYGLALYSGLKSEGERKIHIPFFKVINDPL
ncbi:helix-turn-helix domain-containing protein [Myroides sp. WP-1]|uniref:helix-turn-helix domain-containing protein n=1 Tax=Myroides sp. WP-1 TaxID=2759944 RepID=UPI0015FDB7FC|nr:helix-turn-helix transcriptional regulator [Myroides sp. WP-1]MBB1139209.1 helix-turn-helix transcriptional regulator [Myroides sp. WP-1]